jgi:hypothetical protein
VNGHAIFISGERNLTGQLFFDGDRLLKTS